MTMDNVDKKMVSLLLKDGRRSLSEIGDILGMSHVAVSKRLHKLTDKGTVRITAGINTHDLDLKVLFLALETESNEVTEHLIEKYKDCPRIVTLTPVTGRYNLFAVMVAEDMYSLEAILGTCSMRTEEGIRRSETWFGTSYVLPEYVRLDLAPEKKGGNVTPCSRNCKKCKSFENGRCVGCPTADVYKGTLWVSPMTKSRRSASRETS